MVYRGGLENRFGLTANGGSNPSLSASLRSWRSKSEVAAPERKSRRRVGLRNGKRASARQASLLIGGEVAEWSIAAVLKTASG